MAIDTINKKLAVMEFGDVWEPGLPLSPGTLEQDDKQQLLLGYPGILWQIVEFLVSSLDINGRMHTYLKSIYSSEEPLMPLLLRYLAEQSDTGGYTARMKQLIADATDATTP